MVEAGSALLVAALLRSVSLGLPKEHQGGLTQYSVTYLWTDLLVPLYSQPPSI